LVPLHVRTGTAFRWRPTTLPGQASDVVRVREDGGVHLAVLANGYECGFSTCWPPASRLMLDLFVDEWTASSGSVGDRLRDAFERSRRRFEAQAPSLISPDADFPDDLPAAVLLAVAIEGTTVHAAWIGGDVGILARSFGAASETTPHTLLERFKREHPENAADLSNVPNVLVRSIGPRGLDQDPPDLTVVEATAGDTIILLSRAAFRPCVPIEEAAFAAAAHASPAALAERLAELAFANTDSPYAAVAVLRLDDADVGSAIDRLIDEYQPDARHGDWLREWSLQNRALPVVFEMGGVLGMKRDGSIVSVSWDDPVGSTREETSGVAHLAAVVGASQKYAALATLAPRRPVDAEDCSQCALLNRESDNPRGCPICWYLGWRPPTPPTWFFNTPSGEQPPPANAKATEPSSPWWKRIFRRSA
jgi:hypothetical protein